MCREMANLKRTEKRWKRKSPLVSPYWMKEAQIELDIILVLAIQFVELTKNLVH